MQEKKICNIGKITQPEIDAFFVKSPKMSLIEQNMEEESKIEKKDSIERLIQLDDNYQFNSDIFYP